MCRRSLKRANTLLLAVFQYLEVFLGQAIDRFAGVVGDDHIEHHQARVEGERGVRRDWSGPCSLRRGGRLGEERGYSRHWRRNQQRGSASHKGVT